MKETDIMEIEKMLLENKVVELENTLSDTISFFSASLTLTGLGVALLAIFLGYILNQVFNDKLKKVQEKSDEVTSAHTKIVEINNDIKMKHVLIKDLEKKLKDNEESNVTRDEIIKYYSDMVDFLYEKTEFQRFLFRCEQIELEIEELEITVSEEKIDAYEWSTEIGKNFEKIYLGYSPYEIYQSKRTDFFEVITDIEDFKFHLSKDLGGYLIEVDQGEKGDSLGDLKELYEKLVKYKKLLKKLQK